MRIAAVLVGVSRQLDPTIESLSFGKRDAEKLFALFADLNAANGGTGDEISLLVNESATVAAVRAAIEQAVESCLAGHTQTLFIHFSCHGTPSGELVLFDTMHDDIDGTALALSDVSLAAARAGSVQCIITLDSCFSGTVLGLPGSPNREAFGQLMHSLEDATRALVWAAGPYEKALESQKYAHGLLTYGLIHEFEALRAAGFSSVPTSQWLHGAIAHATDAASAMGHSQTPNSMLGISAGASIPIPPVGEHQTRFAHDVLQIHQVTCDLAGLRAYGFSTAELGGVANRVGVPSDCSLNALQLQAINVGGLLCGKNVMVRAPTSAGKTLIGELAILQHVRMGRKAVVVSPMKALVNEQVSEFREAYAALNLTVVASTGEVADDDDLLRSHQYDVAFLTYEKLASLLNTSSNLVKDLGVVVLDELQTIQDPERGSVVEFLLIRLRKQRQLEGFPQIVGLCGDVGDLRGFEHWLGATPIGPGERPIPLHLRVLSSDGMISIPREDGTLDRTTRFPGFSPVLGINSAKARRHATAVQLVAQLARNGSQVLVFGMVRGSVMDLADDIGVAASLPPVESIRTGLSAVPEDDRHIVTKRLLAATERGVCFHMADLDRDEKRLVEEAFRAGELRVLVATQTLAMGINTPCDVTVIVDTGQRGREEDPIPLISYRNMSGRAGRRLPDGPREGTSYLIAANAQKADELGSRYLVPAGAHLASSLASMPPEDLVVALLNVLGEGGRQDLLTAARDTFWGYQQRDDAGWTARLRTSVDLALDTLLADGIIEYSVMPQIRLTAVGRTCASFGIQVESVRRIRRGIQAIDVSGEPMDAAALLVLTQITVELDKVIVPRNNQAPIPIAQSGPLAGRPTTYGLMTDTTGSSADDLGALIKARLMRWSGIRLWLRGRPRGEVERAYGAGHSGPVLNLLKQATERTSHLLLPVAAVVVATRPDLTAEIATIVPSLLARLEVGGTEAASALYRLRLGLSRRECLQLVGLEIHNEAELAMALSERREALEAALSTPTALRVQQALSNARGRRRSSATDPNQLLLEALATHQEL